MVNTAKLLIAFLAAGSAFAHPVFNRGQIDMRKLGGIFGIADSVGTSTAKAAVQAPGTQFTTTASSAAASAAEAAAGIDVAASIAAASSAAAAVAATETAFDTLGLTPEDKGKIAGLKAKLAIDQQFGDAAAVLQDQEDITFAALAHINVGAAGRRRAFLIAGE
ncbi:hypothetical protein MVEN_00685700 [Mycena venus]|uniref:Small secreted protein n=1 Tax=Mycena venus TaxID=2733690 RepID=A0A8H7D2F9_9AGAR|nr:hypothetical protein MVEN_00685700 [Mycena venus]